MGNSALAGEIKGVQITPKTMGVTPLRGVGLSAVPRYAPHGCGVKAKREFLQKILVRNPKI